MFSVVWSIPLRGNKGIPGNVQIRGRQNSQASEANKNINTVKTSNKLNLSSFFFFPEISCKSSESSPRGASDPPGLLSDFSTRWDGDHRHSRGHLASCTRVGSLHSALCWVVPARNLKARQIQHMHTQWREINFHILKHRIKTPNSDSFPMGC